MDSIIGRSKEIKELERLYRSPKAEFVAVYGRRRVGKTYLIRELFKDRMSFYVTGLTPYSDNGDKTNAKDQLHNFYLAMLKYGFNEKVCPDNWLDMFFMLEQFLENKYKNKRILIFIDELPWFDIAKSGFLKAFEHFWNSWASTKKNLMLIVCGSATSWIEDNLIMNRGGLYNRLTYQILLRPFNLYECRQFYKSMNVEVNQYDVIDYYMIFGGIPYYMGYVSPGKSLAQNIDEMFFGNSAKLKTEFDLLFGSLFTNPSTYIAVMKFLATRHSGYTRDEICKALNIKSGSNLTKVLSSLEASCFIKKYQPFTNSKRELKYKIIDNFCLFYFRFVSENKKNDPNFWQHSLNLPALNSWRGLAFEEVCFSHIDQIKQAIGIGKVISTESAWAVRGNDDKTGCQIDMIIDRNDNVVTLCEMKYVAKKFTVDNDYYATLRERIDTASQYVKKRTNIQMLLITTFGLQENKYSNIFQDVITVEDLFRK